MTGHEQTRAHKFLTRLLAIGALFGAYCLATVGVSGLLMTATDTSAQAYYHGGWHGGWHRGWRGGWRVGGRYYGGVWYGRGRHWYGGRWWAYGVGSCWRPSPIGFVWVCG